VRPRKVTPETSSIHRRMTSMAPELPAFIESRLADIAELARRFGVERLALFGSASTGEFDELRSDVDFVVAFRDMTPAQHADAYFGLLEALQGLLAYRVDLLEEGAIRNPYLRQSVDAAKRTLYAA
jgi:predicted nucleotidyltransferase